MTKLITASEARTMREKSIIDFNQNGMVKVIKHLNNLIEKATSEGALGIDFWCRYHPDINYDEVLGELSETQIKELIKHLESNGYRAWTYSQAFYIRWDELVEPTKPQDIHCEDVRNKAWYSFWRKS